MSSRVSAPASAIATQDMCLDIARDVVASILKQYPIRSLDEMRPLLDKNDLRWPWIEDYRKQSCIASAISKIVETEPAGYWVFGKSCGKSRFMYELSKTLNQQPLIASIALRIPEYSDSDINSNIDNEINSRITAQIIGTMINVDHQQARNILKNAIQSSAAKFNMPLNRLRFSMIFTNELLVAALKAFVEHIQQEKPVTKLVLLVDDAHYSCPTSDVTAVQRVLTQTMKQAVIATQRSICFVLSACEQQLGEDSNNNVIALPERLPLKRVIEDWIPIILPSWKDLFTTNSTHAHRVLAILRFVKPSIRTAVTIIERLAPYEHDLDYFSNPDNIRTLLYSLQLSAPTSDVLLTDQATNPIHDDILKHAVSTTCCADTIWSLSMRETINNNLITSKSLNTLFHVDVLPFLNWNPPTKNIQMSPPMPNSLDDLFEFMQRANDVTVPEGEEILQIQLHRQEAACGMWLIRKNDCGRAYVLIVETISQEQRRTCNEQLQLQHAKLGTADTDASCAVGSEMQPHDWMAGQYWEQGVQAAAKMAMTMQGETGISLTPDSLAEALASGRYMVLLVQTQESKLASRAFNEHVWLIGRDAVKSVLGPIFTLIEDIRECRHCIVEEGSPELFEKMMKPPQSLPEAASAADGQQANTSTSADSSAISQDMSSGELPAITSATTLSEPETPQQPPEDVTQMDQVEPPPPDSPPHTQRRKSHRLSSAPKTNASGTDDTTSTTSSVKGNTKKTANVANNTSDQASQGKRITRSSASCQKS